MCTTVSCGVGHGPRVLSDLQKRLSTRCGQKENRVVRCPQGRRRPRTYARVTRRRARRPPDHRLTTCPRLGHDPATCRRAGRKLCGFVGTGRYSRTGHWWQRYVDTGSGVAGIAESARGGVLGDLLVPGATPAVDGPSARDTCSRGQPGTSRDRQKPLRVAPHRAEHGNSRFRPLRPEWTPLKRQSTVT